MANSEFATRDTICDYHTFLFQPKVSAPRNAIFLWNEVAVYVIANKGGERYKLC